MSPIKAEGLIPQYNKDSFSVEKGGLHLILTSSDRPYTKVYIYTDDKLETFVEYTFRGVQIRIDLSLLSSEDVFVPPSDHFPDLPNLRFVATQEK